jgi:hypothetical protein
MTYITDQVQKARAEKYIDAAKEVAQQATCERAKCGVVIVKNEQIIGRWFNSPAGHDEMERRCAIKKQEYGQKVTDKTCCVHAEQRAIMDALRHYPDQLDGAQLYFSRFYPDGRQRLLGGKIKMYCTICAKMMRDVGIAEFILPGQDGICSFAQNEYVTDCFNYRPE